MSLSDPQNPTIRRTYLIRPLPKLLEQLTAQGESDAIGVCGPTALMTEALPFEGGLEGYRGVILSRCKEAFMAGLLEFDPFSDAQKRDSLLGAYPTLVAAFDAWWTAEEIDTIEISTTWL